MTTGDDNVQKTLWDPWCSAQETHSGGVVLLGDLALKFKKPVDLGFLDFRDRDVRRQVCEREVLLNRRLAPDVYLGVGTLDTPMGRAEPFVVMRRMPADRQLSRLLRAGQDVTNEVREIARLVATFHSQATTGPAIVAEGTREALRRRWDNNLRETRGFSDGLVAPAVLDETSELVHRFLDGRDDLFADRIHRGAVIDGHGDLTADDVFCLPDGPRMLDCLEFDAALRYVDRLDDIAFLAMGFEHLGAPDAARVLIETWAEHVGDPAPPSLVHHFMAYRAFVRAKVGCLAGAQVDDAAHSEVGRYAAATLDHLRAGAVTLVLVGGPPGSGKSTLSGAIADRLGLVVLSSDRVRKESAGIDPTASAAAALGQGIYDRAHTEATYDLLLHRAELLLRSGESVVLDASWGRVEDRRRAQEVAERAVADLVELRCALAPAVAASRIRQRQGISDADETVAAALRASEEPWPSSHEIDTRLPASECVDAAERHVRPQTSVRG